MPLRSAGLDHQTSSRRFGIVRKYDRGLDFGAAVGVYVGEGDVLIVERHSQPKMVGFLAEDAGAGHHMGARRERLWFGGTRRSRSMRCRMCRRVGATGWLRHRCRNSLLKLRRRQLIFRVQRWIAAVAPPMGRQPSGQGSYQALPRALRRSISHSSPPPFPPKHNIARRPNLGARTPRPAAAHRQ